MTCWQVRATLENGAVVVFGTEAQSDEAALDLAHERLEDTGQLVAEVDVDQLAPASGR